jgi:hypothetical protein
VQLPQTVVEAEAPLLQRPDDQLARVENVAGTAVDDPAEERLADRTWERRLDERLDGRIAERRKLHPTRSCILPERVDRVRRRFAGTDRCDDEHPGRGRQVEDECGRRRVEQMRIIDPEADRAPGGAGPDALRAAPDELERLVGAHVVGYERREGTQRDRRRAGRALSPVGERSGAFGRVDHLTCQP